MLEEGYGKVYIRRDIGTGDQEDPDVDSLIQFEGESAAVRWNVGWLQAFFAFSGKGGEKCLSGRFLPEKMVNRIHFWRRKMPFVRDFDG